MHTWIEINEKHLINNYNIFCNLTGRTNVLPVLKSNAYGHGLRDIAAILIKEGCNQFGVNYLFEAETIRALGFDGRILVLGPVQKQDLVQAEILKTEVFLGGRTVLDAWKSLDKKPIAHIKFDTGMSRQGFLSKDAAEIVEEVKPYSTFIKGVCTHLADVEDVLKHDYSSKQLSEFEVAITAFKNAGLEVECHAASSASCLLLKDSRFNLSRIGISLYGMWPSKSSELSYLKIHESLAELRPVLSWQCKIANVKSVKTGQFIGYGCTYKAVQDMKVAVLPVGYYEGYSRIAGEASSYVLIQGKKCPIVGRICMNMMIVDVSHIRKVSEEDHAVLIGDDRDESITSEDFASWAQTINYEVVTSLNSAIPRKVV